MLKVTRGKFKVVLLKETKEVVGKSATEQIKHMTLVTDSLQYKPLIF